MLILSYEPHRDEACLRGFRPGPTQTRLYIHRRWLEAGNFGGLSFLCSINEGADQLRSYFSCAVTAQLICAFVFAYAKSNFYYDMAHIDFLKQMIMTMEYSLINSVDTLYSASRPTPHPLSFPHPLQCTKTFLGYLKGNTQV